MNGISRKLVCAVVASALLLPAASASAHDEYREKKKDGISAGEVIAGAVVLGGIAALIASSSKKGDRDDYDSEHGSRWAVERCANAARDRAGRYGRAKVTEITRVDRVKRGYVVEGRIRVKGFDGGWRDNDRWDDDDRGGGKRRGSFMCRTKRGDIRDLELYGFDRW